MANRRSGGMGGPRGNRGSFQHPSFQGSPWQGAPNSGLMSQISSNPQQLALVLNSLLQPQPNNPPSLLSLNTSGYSSQDRGFGRYGNRGREMRRVEPYNKNRGGNWRGDRKKNQNKKDNKKDDKKSEKEGTEKEADKKDGEQESDGHGGPYSSVPVKLLNCFVCCKEMWDGESMKKHVKGRAHRQMLESLEDSIHCIVNILREHMRVSEEKKVIEIQRLHRLNRKGGRSREPESHCNMCDMKFLGKIVSHRKTEGHQRLKRYLHPTCGLCDKEFPSRMEWIEHRLTPEHLRKHADSLNNRCGGANGDIIIWDDEEEPEIEEQSEEGEEEKKTKKEDEIETESSSPILEMTDDLEQLQNLPVYKPDRALSVSSLKPFTGFICELCDRTFETEELSQNHLKTKIHYYAFVDAAKAKYKEEIQKKDETKKKLDESQESETKENGDSEMYDPEEACNENEEIKEEATGESKPEENEDVEMTEEEVKEEKEEKEEKVEVKEEPKTPARQAKAKRGRK